MRLADGAHVYLRGRDAVQFGLDATRAGIVETTHAPLIMATLLGTRRPRTRGDLLTALCGAGLSREAATSLVDDLLVYRILVPVEPRSVILLGRGRLATAVSELLRDARLSVRTPIRGESEFAYLAEADGSLPVIVVDRLAHSRAMSPMLTRLARTWIPVSVVDHRGVIGPLRIDAAGPCPLCADLHHTDTDPYWHRVVTQLPGGPVHPAPATVAGTAAHTAAVVGALLGVPAPPGVTPLQPRPGEVTVTDPWTGTQRTVLEVHPQCPVCFTYSRKAASTASS